MTQAAMTPPDHGQMQPVAEDLFWLRFDLPFRLNHINLFVLDGIDGWIILDCGLNDAATAAHWQALLDGPLKGRPIERIIVSHNHVDHVGYAGPLAAITGAPIAMGEAEYRQTLRMLELAGPAFGALLEGAYRRYGLDQDALAMAREDHDRYSRFVAPLPEVDILAAGDTIRSRGGHWHVRLDSGHSTAQVGLIDAQRGLYLAGDFLLPRISPNVSADLAEPEIDRLGAYLDYLAAMQSLPEETLILPGHDWPFSGGAERAAALIAHHHARLDALLKAAANAPITTADAIQVLFDRVFGAHEIFFAAGEARAHLAHLVATGRMAEENGPEVSHFRLD